jgi:intergrase/recombinase
VREKGYGGFAKPNDPRTKGSKRTMPRPRRAEQRREDLARLRSPTEIRGQAIEFRATRSSCASRLDEAGVSEQVRKRLLGHAAWDVTERHDSASEMER